MDDLEQDAVTLLLEQFPDGHPAVDELIGVRSACSRLKEWVAERDAEIERLKAEKTALGEDFVTLSYTATEKAGEIERLQELLRGTGANRYWEGRWRDAEAENDRLRSLLRMAWSHVISEGDDTLSTMIRDTLAQARKE
jgi:hypothetical protein